MKETETVLESSVSERADLGMEEDGKHIGRKMEFLDRLEDLTKVHDVK